MDQIETTARRCGTCREFDDAALAERRCMVDLPMWIGRAEPPRGRVHAGADASRCRTWKPRDAQPAAETDSSRYFGGEAQPGHFRTLARAESALARLADMAEPASTYEPDPWKPRRNEVWRGDDGTELGISAAYLEDYRGACDRGTQFEPSVHVMNLQAIEERRMSRDDFATWCRLRDAVCVKLSRESN